MELGELTLENTTPFVGITFTIALPGDQTASLKLDAVLPYEVRQRRVRAGKPPKRAPFAMYFLGDPKLVLPQGMYNFRSDSVSIDGIFIVPVGQDEEATEYEAVFT